MNKSLIAFVATSLVSVSAMAGSVAVEIREGNLAKTAPDTTEWRVEAWDKVLGLDTGAELQVKQVEHQGALKSAVSAKVGKSFSVSKVSVLPYAEYGQRFTAGSDVGFYGVGAKASVALFDGVAVSAGYRHREAYNYVLLMNENRVNAGVSVNLSKKVAAGVGVYKTTGTTQETTFGVSLARNF